ncbi:hypothetical protein JR334_10980 [Clostridia bacterium]|nr:hypothetical protein JR334_10980 [Clostridia bacterium]
MSYESRFKDPMIDELFQAILALESEEDCYRFFEDLCTVSELHSMAQRLVVARLLDEDVTYSQIEEKTGASSATISRVKKCLQYGADGYHLVLDKGFKK